MGEEYRAKVFKSGNSLALRLPKALGLAEGQEVRLVPHEDGSFSLWKEQDTKSVLMSLYGSMSDGYMRDGRDDPDQPERDWNRPIHTSDAA